MALRNNPYPDRLSNKPGTHACVAIRTSRFCTGPPQVSSGEKGAGYLLIAVEHLFLEEWSSRSNWNVGSQDRTICPGLARTDGLRYACNSLHGTDHQALYAALWSAAHHTSVVSTQAWIRKKPREGFGPKSSYRWCASRRNKDLSGPLGTQIPR